MRIPEFGNVRHPQWCAPAACDPSGLLHRGVGQLYIPRSHRSTAFSAVPVRADDWTSSGTQTWFPMAVELSVVGEEPPVIDLREWSDLLRFLERVPQRF